MVARALDHVALEIVDHAHRKAHLAVRRRHAELAHHKYIVGRKAAAVYRELGIPITGLLVVGLAGWFLLVRPQGLFGRRIGI